MHDTWLIHAKWQLSVRPHAGLHKLSFTAMMMRWAHPHGTGRPDEKEEIAVTSSPGLYKRESRKREWQSGRGIIVTSRASRDEQRRQGPEATCVYVRLVSKCQGRGDPSFLSFLLSLPVQLGIACIAAKRTCRCKAKRKKNNFLQIMARICFCGCRQRISSILSSMV